MGTSTGYPTLRSGKGSRWSDSTGTALADPTGADVQVGNKARTDPDGESLGAPLEITQQGTTTGILYATGHYGDVRYIVAAASPAQSIDFANRAVLDYDSAGNGSGIGHYGAHLAWYRRTGTGDPSFGLAGEDKVENLVSGTWTLAKGREIQLAANAGTISLWAGCTSQILANVGTISAAILNNVDVASNAGTITTLYGYLVSDMSARNIASRYGFKNLDPGATVHSLAPIVDSAILRSTPASGATVNVHDASTKRSYTRLELQHGGTIAALTIDLPTAAQMEDGHTLKIVALNAVTAVTWAGTSGALAILSAVITSLNAYVTYRIWYSASSNVWHVD